MNRRPKVVIQNHLVQNLNIAYNFITTIRSCMSLIARLGRVNEFFNSVKSIKKKNH